MRTAWMVGLLLAAACSTRSQVPCSTQAECARFNAVCLEGVCRLPEEVDLGGYDLTEVSVDPDLAVSPDLAVTDDMATAPPDLALSCAAQQSCPLDKPICGVDEICRACVATDRPACAAANLLQPRCDESTGACAACRNDAAHEAIDCPESGLGVCGSDGSCRKACSSHGDCASGLCDPRIVTTDQASCARAEEIVYVRPIGGCTPPHAGTQADPFCTVDEAMAARPDGGFIRVLSGNTSLTRIHTPIAKPYVIVGTGGFVAGDEQIGGVTKHTTAVVVTKGGRLYVEGVNILGTTGSGFACDGTGGSAQLVLRDVDINSAKTVAVLAKNCDVDLDRVRMREGESGVDHDGGTLRIVNTYIYRNAGLAVRTTSATTAGLIAHLTVADNVPANSSIPGGFVCGGAMTVRNSISWGNRAVSGASYSGACAFRYSSVDPMVAGTGNNNTQPQFTPGDFMLGIPSTYHLKGPTPVGVNPCCTGNAEVIPEVTLDWDRQVRNAYPEIGADEF